MGLFLIGNVIKNEKLTLSQVLVFIVLEKNKKNWHSLVDIASKQVV